MTDAKKQESLHFPEMPWRGGGIEAGEKGEIGAGEEREIGTEEERDANEQDSSHFPEMPWRGGGDRSRIAYTFQRCIEEEGRQK